MSAPHCTTAKSSTSAKSVSHQNSSFGTTSTAGFATSSATGLKHFRVNLPSAAASLRQCQQMISPGSQQQKANNRESQYEKNYQQFPNMAAVARFRPPAQQQKARPKVSKTLSKPSDAPTTTTVSPSKFFMQGSSSIDFDEYIGKPLLTVSVSQLPNQASQNQAVPKSVALTASSVEADSVQLKKQQSLGHSGAKRKLDRGGSVQKPNADAARNKQQSPVCAGVKRKSQLSESLDETDSPQMKTECGFADKFSESSYIQGLVNNANADGPGNKCSTDTKQSAVRMLH